MREALPRLQRRDNPPCGLEGARWRHRDGSANAIQPSIERIDLQETLVTHKTNGPWAGELNGHRIDIRKMIGQDQRAAGGRDPFAAAGLDPIQAAGDQHGDLLDQPGKRGTTERKRGRHGRLGCLH